MKCPVMSAQESITLDGKVIRTTNCMEGECAWWDSGFKRCAILSLKWEVSCVEGMLSEIMAKLPVSRQSY